MSVEIEKQGETPQMPQESPPPSAEEIVTPEVLDRIVKGYDEDQEWTDFSAKLGTSIGDNYMSIMYAVTIELKHRKSGDKSTLNVMLKTMPRNAVRQQMISESGAFIKDSKMYTDVLPSMIEFQRSKGLKEDEIFIGWPKCYTTFHDGFHDYLGLENLRIHGFKMANRQTGLDMKHASLTLKSIAKFHAISYAMYRGDYDVMMGKFPWLEEKMFTSPDKVVENMKLWMQGTMAHETDVVRKAGFEDAAKLLERIPEEKFNFWGQINDLLSKSKRAVINHGDCWTNNMLFTYKDKGSVDQLKFVDFQLARCASRCIDLGYFIHTSLPMNILNEKENEILKIYHDEFTNFVELLGVDTVECDLTFDSLLEEYQAHRLYGVLMGLFLAPMLAADANNIPDMEGITQEDFNNPEGAKEFMNQLMGDMSTKKICDLACNHLTKCSEFK